MTAPAERHSPPVDAPTSIEICVKLKHDELAALDSWIAAHPKPRPSRPQAIHRLMICGLLDHPGQ